jgi:predicted DNA binding CopG/RHH family protein
LALVIGGKEENDMKKDIEYTNAPIEIRESLDRAAIIPNFIPTPEEVAELAAKRIKKPVSIYLSVETIEKFKAAAKKDGSRYQTMISNVLDTYTQQFLSGE